MCWNTYTHRKIYPLHNPDTNRWDFFLSVYMNKGGLGSSVSIVTGYELDGLGIESWWGRDFSAPFHTGPGAHQASCTMGTGSFPGVKSGWGVMLIPHPLLVLWLWKCRAIPLLPPMGRTACTEPQCLYKGTLYLAFYMNKAPDTRRNGSIELRAMIL